jgi:uncharacterized protein YfkK (UPF0435 family)
MLKSFLSFVAFILAGLQGVAAQSYVMSGIQKTDKGQMQYEVLGKVEGRYWIYKNNEGVSTIAQYNDQMQLVQQNDLVFLPKKLNAIEFVTKSNRVYAFYQFQAATTVYAMVAELDEKGQLVGTPVIVDTAEKIRPGSNTKVFNLIESQDRSKLLFFSVNTTNAASIKIKTMALSTPFAMLNEAKISINSQNKKSQLSDFALDNKGNLFCLRNAEQPNAAPVVSLLYMAADGSEVIETPIVNNSLVLDDIRLKINNANGTVIVNSFYATEKKGNIEGMYTFIWDIAKKQNSLSNASRFTDALRDAVTDKRNLKNAFDDFYFDQVQPNADGGFTIIAEAARTNSNRNIFSRWDFFWGGPFYNPFIFNYWNRPFGFYPWGRLGWGMMGPWGWGGWGGFGGGWGWGGMGGWGIMGPWGWNSWMMNPFANFGYPSVTYSAGKVAILNFDANANIQSVKTIDKQQSDLNVDQFIGYGQINNTDGTNFLYYQKSKGVKQLVHQQLSASGTIVKGNPIMINEKQVEWMPRSLKQVGEKEAILPYQSKGKLGFAKITIQ